MILTIKEFDKIGVREKRNLQQLQISKSDAQFLQSLVIDDMPVFKWGNRCLVAQQWVGVITLPDFSIEILPKISTHLSHNECRDILTRMLLVAHQPATTKKLPATVSTQKNSLSEVLIATFLTALEHYTKHGLFSSYVKIQSNIDVVKGRIVFGKQFNQNILSPTRFHCAYSKYIRDNDLNQFFLCCLSAMKAISRDAENQRRIRTAISAFDDISTISPTSALSKQIVFNSTNSSASEAYEYGKLFLSNHFISLCAGKTAINVMLFDMNRLFESFIMRCLRHIYGNKLSYQSSLHYLVYNPDTNKKYVKLRPDMILHRSDSDALVIDTKWKLPQSFAKESDVHQMNAYSTGLPNVSCVCLLYPETDAIRSFVGDYEFLAFDNSHRKLRIRAVDLRLCLNWNAFLNYLKTLIG